MRPLGAICFIGPAISESSRVREARQDMFPHFEHFSRLVLAAFPHEEQTQTIRHLPSSEEFSPRAYVLLFC